MWINDSLNVVEENDSEIRKSINEKLDLIQRLNPNEFKTLNNIDLKRVVLRRDENIFNNNFIHNLKYFK